jgi:hypothetical protein
MRRIQLLILVAGSSLVTGAGFAHHSFAAVYDPEKPITLRGVVTQVEWLNPHAHFFVDVQSEDGAVENWDFELASPNGLMRLGWTRKSLNAGDEVAVDGFVARDGSRRVNTRSVTMADGSKMFGGAPVQGGLR